MEQTGSNGARPRDRRPAAARRERAAGAKVDLGPLPKLLGYTLRRANQASWRTYVSFIGENKIRPELFSLLCLVRANPGIAQIELGTHLGVDKASIVALLDRATFPRPKVCAPGRGRSRPTTRVASCRI